MQIPNADGKQIKTDILVSGYIRGAEKECKLSIPEDIRPKKDQPFYHLLAENEVTEYVAYVSEQNLLYDDTGEPVRHPQVGEIFGTFKNGYYEIQSSKMH